MADGYLPLSLWSEHPAPKDDAWGEANATSYRWKVLIINGEAFAELQGKDEDSSEQTFSTLKPCQKSGLLMRTNDGWIFGRNHGEWGGGLEWRQNLDSTSATNITDEPVCDYFRRNDKIIVFEGLAHMGCNAGAVVEAFVDNQTWTSRKLVGLPSCPEAIFVRSEDVLVATHGQLLVWSYPDKIEPLVESGWWGGLYPTSIVETADGQIFIGVRRGVVRVSKGEFGYKPTWLLPADDEARCKTDPRLKAFLNCRSSRGSSFL